MAELTPTSAENLSLGNRVGRLAGFASINNHDTWKTGLGTVEAVFITDGNQWMNAGATYGTGVNSGVVTFHVGIIGGPLTNPKVLAIGFG